MKRGVLFLVLLAIFLNLTLIVFAQVDLEKTDINLTIKPGEKIVDTIVLQNASNENILLKAYFEDLVYPPPFEGIREARPLGSTPWSFGGWASVAPAEFILPASGKIPVTYIFNVPQDAEGGYYGVLLFERGSKASETAGLGIDVKIRTGTRFFLETKNRKKEAKIEDAVLVKEGMRSSLLNTGNVLLVSKVSWHIINAKDIIVKRAELKRYIPPGEKVSFTVNLPEDLPSGTYTLLIICDSGERKPLIKEVALVKGDAGEIKILRQKD